MVEVERCRALHWGHIIMLFLRFCSASLSAYVFALFLPGPGFLVINLAGCIPSHEDCTAEFEWYGRLAIASKVTVGCLWLLTWLVLELFARRHSVRQRSNLLTHLRYGPLAILVFSIAAIIGTDQLLIQFSRWEIVNYIYSDISPRETPSFRLHHNSGQWCGNGMAATEYANYGETPAAYFDNPDPAVRARALQASIEVYDWLNHPGGGPSIEVLKKALNDPDPLVREIAVKYQAELGL
jgi:hypothetical protein